MGGCRPWSVMQRRPGFPAKLPVPGNAAAGKPVVALTYGASGPVP